MSAAPLPTIAVIVPNWNDARFLPRCLRSVLEQETPADQLIIVDDASTDNSVALIRQIISGNSRAELIVNASNLGVYGAVDRALERARSDYVLFLAANDFVLPGIFTRARDCLSRSPGIGLWSAMVWRVDEADNLVRLHPSPVIALRDRVFSPEECVKLAHRVGNWFTGTTLIYRRDAVQAADAFDPAYRGAADLITALVVASRHGVAYTPEPFGAFRIHAGSHSSSTLSDVARLEAMLDRLAVRGPELSPQLFTKAFVERIVLRYRFAAVRESAGTAISTVAARFSGWRRLALDFIDRWVPRKLERLRVALAFAILSPFDLWPTLMNRLLGWVIVRLRIGLSGEALP
ncbi:MAG: glycosyltransferase [Betaproteobacteria bacterium]|nr:glycosyltransferase [Betaproteobacteria bacterium]